MSDSNAVNDKNTDLISQRREEIIASAKKIFAQNGFRRTTIDHIADDLSVGKGTIYRYFSSKKALFLGVFEHGMLQLNSIMMANTEPVPDPQVRIATAVRTYLGFFENDRDFIEIMMQVRSEFKDDYKRVYIELYNDYIVRIQKNLRNGIEKGLFRENLDVEKTAEAMSATLHGVLQGFYLRTFLSENPSQPPRNSSKQLLSGEVLTDRCDAIISLILNGLHKKRD